MFWDRVAGVYDLFANYSHIRSFHTSSRIFLYEAIMPSFILSPILALSFLFPIIQPTRYIIIEVFHFFCGKSYWGPSSRRNPPRILSSAR